MPMSKNKAFLVSGIGVVAVGVCILAGCISHVRTINWTRYTVEDSQTNRLAVAQIVRTVATSHGLSADTKHPPTPVTSAPADTNQYSCFAAYHSGDGEHPFSEIVLTASAWHGKAEITLMQPKRWSEARTKTFLAIEEAVTVHCRQSFGASVDIKAFDRHWGEK
jgi:hypothetical protein